MSDDARARLAHDVGKYVARIAKNVAEGSDVPGALLPLLAKDLYEAPGGGRPSARFSELAEGIDDPRIEEARGLLARIDAMEPDVRAGTREACNEACVTAIRVERLLRELASEAGR
jgi:hypothetical protein